jgi:hypothetical protein
MWILNRFPDHLSHFVFFGQQHGSYDEKCWGCACKTNYDVSPDLMFCNTTIAQRWKFSHVGKLSLLIKIFSTYISQRKLIHQQE